MRFHVAAFVISFCVSICIMLCLVPKPPVVVKWPRPETGDHQYTSADGACFKVEAQKVSCDADMPVKPQPVHDIDTKTEPKLEFRLPFSMPFAKA